MKPSSSTSDRAAGPLPHHEDSGPRDAPVLVLGSSLGTTTALWEPLLPVLERHFRVIRVDHPGHGGSAPRAFRDVGDLGRGVLALLDSLGVREFRHAGVSLGGMVGMWLAAHAPDRVERLALCCTTASYDDPEPWRARADLVLARGVGATAEGTAARWFTPAFGARGERLLAGLSGVDPLSYAAACGALARLDLRPLLPTIGAPTLVIAGEDDAGTPPEHGKAIADLIPGARFHVVPGAHLAVVESPDAVAEVLVPHLVGP
ncbi:alpha/beta fold hydrolase [Actinosynnema mirum]|uniref:3-oxoadipate enol-lactonase n=1 Tax=Actinosynnema mirum (strain ATCC 29888 / DSM 43827 / JCM 3225 / NBRC 14064 / NCIMB 13271 / NRRL B-12336 / IMRU 3971 / 101) TaxID=446462 RepID=C6WS85_ACTMD|nr:alpha/beta fold hydrolase [Actinosynnema mirum]ACU38905.1 3-oxoadipate enol-lactonase [Actinosynnema mirum DSM 43827]